MWEMGILKDWKNSYKDRKLSTYVQDVNDGEEEMWEMGMLKDSRETKELAKNSELRIYKRHDEQKGDYKWQKMENIHLPSI